MANVLENHFAFSNITWYWGICAESTRTKGQRELEIYVPDLTPIRNGDVKNKGSFTKSKLFNVISQSWEEYQSTLSKTISAEYLGFESSREVPDMYKGQQVMVVTYGCDDRWFWVPLERDDYIKTFEHVRFRCPDIALIHKQGCVEEDQERVSDLTDDNTYFLEIDTKYYKRILLSTAGTDGEKYRYFIKMDAKEHSIELWDGLTDTSSKEKKCKDVPHNTIKIESDPKQSHDILLKGRITLQNEAGCTLMLEDEDMKIVVPRNLTIEVGKNYVTNVEGDMSLTTTGNRHTLIKSNFVEQVLGSVDKDVTLDYTHWYRSNRKEEVGINYTRYVVGNLIEQCAMQTNTVLGSYAINVGAAFTRTVAALVTEQCANQNNIIAGQYIISTGANYIRTVGGSLIEQSMSQSNIVADVYSLNVYSLKIPSVINMKAMKINLVEG